jgi:hypothetical protein
MDAKATVKIGSFSRGGKSRVPTFGCDHDYQPSTKLTPYGIFLPQLDELFFYFTESKVTADFIVDVLEQWWISVKDRFSEIRTLLINQDNGLDVLFFGNPLTENLKCDFEEIRKVYEI